MVARKRPRQPKGQIDQAGKEEAQEEEEAEEAEEAEQESCPADDHEDTIVIGTYDGGLLGFRVTDGVQKFGYAPHTGCVKTLDCSQAGRLASGGTDHMIRLFNLARGVELGELQEHNDTVACLKFCGASSLITGGDDGQVCIWQCANWDLLLKFRAHKVGITCLAVHPSGRLMASAGRDKSLRLWDLMRGTSAADLSSTEAVETLEWSPNGGLIAALSPLELLVVNVQDDAVATFRDPGSSGLMRVTLSAAMFLTDSTVLLGDGKGALRVIGFTHGKAKLSEVCKLPTDDTRSRVKALARGGSIGKTNATLAVGTSSGRVEIWRVISSAWGTREAQQSDFSRLRIVETGARLTCLAMWLSSASAEVESNEVAAKPKGLKKRRKQGALAKNPSQQ